MNSKTKKRFINVIPLSLIAKDRFENIMNSFHSCIILDETSEKFYLSSLNEKYYFWVQKEGNEHWKLTKR